MNAPVEQELLPCPFCEEPEELIDHGNHISCGFCGASSGVIGENQWDLTGPNDTYVTGWNIRPIPKPSGEVSPLKSIVLAHRNVDNIAARNIKATENDTSQEDIWQARRDLDAAIRRAYPAVGVDIVRRHNPDFKPSGEVNLSLTDEQLQSMDTAIGHCALCETVDDSEYHKWVNLLTEIRAGCNAALPKWVKEPDVPQEWRDGTDMLVWVNDCRYIAFWGKTAHVPLYGWLDPSTFDGDGYDLMNPQPEYVCQLPKGPEQ